MGTKWDPSITTSPETPVNETVKGITDTHSHTHTHIYNTHYTLHTAHYPLHIHSHITHSHMHTDTYIVHTQIHTHTHSHTQRPAPSSCVVWRSRVRCVCVCVCVSGVCGWHCLALLISNKLTTGWHRTSERLAAAQCQSLGRSAYERGTAKIETDHCHTYIM